MASTHVLEKRQKMLPEHKRPKEVFGAGPGYIHSMGLSGDSGTHLYAVVTAAEAQAAVPQLSAWHPPLSLGWGSSAGALLVVLQGGALCLCLLLDAGPPGGG